MVVLPPVVMDEVKWTGRAGKVSCKLDLKDRSPDQTSMVKIEGGAGN